MRSRLKEKSLLFTLILLIFFISLVVIDNFFIKESPANNMLISTKKVMAATKSAIETDISTKKAGTIIAKKSIDFDKINKYFTSSKIKKNDGIYKRIINKSYKKNKYIKLSDLRYLKVLHYNYKHKIQVGEIIVNKKIATKVKKIFVKLFKKGYEIKSMFLIDKYWKKNSASAADKASCNAGNSSGFCLRFMTNSKTKLSKHGKGMALDINTRENPYVRLKNGKWICEYKKSKKYVNRKKIKKHMIHKKDLCYKYFIKEGAKWGGNWHTIKDYQHFEF